MTTHSPSSITEQLGRYLTDPDFTSVEEDNHIIHSLLSVIKRQHEAVTAITYQGYQQDEFSFVIINSIAETAIRESAPVIEVMGKLQP